MNAKLFREVPSPPFAEVQMPPCLGDIPGNYGEVPFAPFGEIPGNVIGEIPGGGIGDIPGSVVS